MGVQILAQDKTVYRKKASITAFRLYQQARNSPDRSTSILPNSRLPTIVKNDIAPPPSPPIPPDASFNMAQNIFRSNSRFPVMPNDIPHHRSQPKLSCDAQNIRTPRPMRRSEVAYALAQNIFQSSIAIGQLLPHLRRRLQRQPGMSHRMVTDQVPRPLHRANDIRSLPHEPPNHKKSRSHLVLSQDIQQLKGVRIVWAIVESQRNLIRIAVCDQRPPKKLRPRRQRGIGAQSNSGDARNGRAGQNSTHWKRD